MKLWQKNTNTSTAVETFTVGNDREMDLFLAPFDVQGSLAHIKMLETIDLLTSEDWKVLSAELKKIYKEIEAGNFTLQDDVEDIHSQVELLLTERLGEVGKKIHSGRSRNDQVLVDLKLFFRSAIEQLVQNIEHLFQLLQQKSEAFKENLLPGYTHLQLAMPSSFGLWLGAYAESLVDDVITLQSAYKVVNKNPLGSAAGYGSSFPLNRTLTTQLLGFEDLNYNVVYAQMSRGKSERIVAQAVSNVASTLNKLSMDCCLYMNQNFGFISFPDELTTGSSIMPHKKNPDVFELIRAKCNQLQALPNDVALLTTNLPSGYHRDFQLLKEYLFPAFVTINSCLDMMHLMISNMKVKENLLKNEQYKYLFSVEEVNKLVLQGTPFRDAYKKVGLEIEAGKFEYSTTVNHTHEGSIGNLCTEQIKDAMRAAIDAFEFGKYHKAIEDLTA
ncbi:argininosuccinate lyase [Segetibacter aerophilus]|uniref:Argininosuccinate lyase n=1 Tax=Segetibacter aerophilus TaxID=670293 RepID=A0A512BCJ7_9BACT|nr:argininosuccinate lyase [Segetibacter aerophilus]GEO09681.1 argininosuccinate lyase [Segetibacter aerophilus]